MKGHEQVINVLNDVLTNELTAINQFFLHARILQHWGLTKLGAKEYQESIEEMKHADDLIKRILFLEGLPNVQRLHKIQVGQNIQEIIQADLDLELRAVATLRSAVQICEQQKDFVTQDQMQEVLKGEEGHVEWLETQLSLINKIGVQNYLQSQI